MKTLLRALLPMAILSQAMSVHAGDEPAVPAAPQFPFDAQSAREYQQTYARWAKLPLELTNRQGMVFVLVPPGTFVMGSPPDEQDRNGSEAPHQVTLTRPVYFGKYEVTRGQFQRFVEATNYTTDVEKNGGGHAHDAKAVWEHRPGTNWKRPGYAGAYEPQDSHAIVHVSHTDANAFCRWLDETSNDIAPSGFTGHYRLPTEAEWEWACRAGSGKRFWWGDDEDTSGQFANVGDRSLRRVHPEWPRKIMPMDDKHAFVAPVGSYRANGFGLHDMLGNVWEFCSSRHGPYPKEAVTDQGDLGKQESYSVRGGGWSNFPADCRCAMRNSDPPHFGHSNLGFRVVMEVAKKP